MADSQTSLFGTPKAPFRRRVVKKEETIPQKKAKAESANIIAARIILESPESIERYGGEGSLMVLCSRMCLERAEKTNGRA